MCSQVLACVSIATLLTYFAIQRPSLLRARRLLGTAYATPAAGIGVKDALPHRGRQSGLGYANFRLKMRESREVNERFTNKNQGTIGRLKIGPAKGPQNALDRHVKLPIKDDHKKRKRIKEEYVGSLSPKALVNADDRKASFGKRLPAMSKKPKRKVPKSMQVTLQQNIPIDTMLAREGPRLGLKVNNVTSEELSDASRCPQDAVLTINPGGRMGNKLCRYLTVWILARRIPNAQVRILPRMEEKLNVYLSIKRRLKALPDKCNSVISWRHARLGENGTFPKLLAQGQSIMVDGGPCPLSWFYPRREAILSELKWNANTSLQVKRRLALVPAGTKTLVGVHIRRSDYASWLQKQLNGHLVSPSYLHCALKLARKRYRRPAFLVTSDDMVWSRRNIPVNGDVLFVGSNASEVADMATLANCDHSIVTYGTFGYLAAFLAGGDIIAPTGFSDREYPLPSQPEGAGVRVTRLPDTVNC